jgi:hypothetical protein
VIVEVRGHPPRPHSHLWPDSDDRTRDAIDSVLGCTADPLRTKGLSTS